MWDSRPHKNPGKNGQFDTALYVQDPPPGLFGRVSSRRGSARRSLNLFDQSEFKFDEESSMYGPRDSGQCATEKDTIERLQNTAGIFLAVSFCGVVLQARELYRSEGKQQVALFLMDLICAYHEMGVLLPIAICYDDMYGTQHAPTHPSALYHPCLPTLILLLSLLATCAPRTRAHFTCTTGLYWLEFEFAPLLRVLCTICASCARHIPLLAGAPNTGATCSLGSCL